MRKFILPTAEIFFEFRHFEPILYFRDEGLRGVIRDLVLLPSCPKTREEEFEQFRSSVLEEYDRSVDVRTMENMFSRREYASWLVELMLDMADLAVFQMISQYFDGLDYEVDRKDCQWLGVDLIALIHVR